MPGRGRGYGRAFMRNYPEYGFLLPGGLYGLINLVFLFLILYVLFKLLLVAAGYVIALAVLYLLWVALRHGL
ncbi:hypothetical protein [Thermococcus waiotapuensis]|uniref:Uncharacterized protein n=1 Tax=Thermococcus waiotapuensis TaxID=90909 RepID=A0AAE4T315_9EURY|nr:hypothetical protein [Thermococcus waiotapuensis]MDV3104602.1 hypothetical protein [Thermococcus waiotapuensis]